YLRPRSTVIKRRLRARTGAGPCTALRRAMTVLLQRKQRERQNAADHHGACDDPAGDGLATAVGVDRGLANVGQKQVHDAAVIGPADETAALNRNAIEPATDDFAARARQVDLAVAVDSHRFARPLVHLGRMLPGVAVEVFDLGGPDAVVVVAGR